MSDKTYITLFVGAGLVMAYLVTVPIRKSKMEPLATTSPAASINQASSTQVDQLYAEGTLVVTTSLKKVSSDAVLFLFVRAKGMKGAPLAVKRIPTPTFPLNFSLSVADSMMAMDYYDGDITVTARLAQNGVAGPKQAGDLEGEAQIKKGGPRKVAIKLAE